MSNTYQPYLDPQELVERNLWINAIRNILGSWTTREHMNVGSGVLAMFVRKRKWAFAVVDARDSLSPLNQDRMLSLIQRCGDAFQRAERLSSCRKKGFMHLIIIHRGEVRIDNFQSLVPFHYHFLPPAWQWISITLVDTITSRIDQYRGFEYYGRVWNRSELDALLRLRYFQQPNLGVVGTYHLESQRPGIGLWLCWILLTIFSVGFWIVMLIVLIVVVLVSSQT